MYPYKKEKTFTRVHSLIGDVGNGKLLKGDGHIDQVLSGQIVA